MQQYRFKSIMMLILLVFTVASCREEDDSNKGNNSKTVEINTVLESNGQPINIGETITLSNGRDFRLTKFRIYLSNINLVKANGDKTPITEVALTDVGDESTGSFSTAIEAGNYNSVEIDLGLNPVLNDSDPTSFPTDHPLSTFNQMYWSMLKYRFLILEGRSNISGTLGSNDDVLHAYHPGTNPSFRQVSFNLDSSFSDKLNSGNVNLELVFDLDEIFTTEPAIDMVAEPQTHSEPVDIAIAVKMMNNLAATLKLRQP